MEDVRAEISARIAAGNVELPVFPRIAQRVLAMTDDPNQGAAAVARLIERDPALCGKVLSTASSSLYSGGVRIVSVKQAVARLGMSEIAMIAVSASVRASVLKKSPFDRNLAAWWRLSVGTALFAKEIARRRRVSVDTAFLCGLMHAIGRPVVLNVAAELSKTIGEVSSEDAEVLADEFQTDLGLLLSEPWKLPKPVSAVIGFVHNQTPPPDHEDETLTTRLAIACAQTLGAEEGEEDETISVRPEVSELNLYADDVSAVLECSEKIQGQVEAMA